MAIVSRSTKNIARSETPALARSRAAAALVSPPSRITSKSPESLRHWSPIVAFIGPKRISRWASGPGGRRGAVRVSHGPSAVSDAASRPHTRRMAAAPAAGDSSHGWRSSSDLPSSPEPFGCGGAGRSVMTPLSPGTSLNFSASSALAASGSRTAAATAINAPMSSLPLVATARSAGCSKSTIGPSGPPAMNSLSCSDWGIGKPVHSCTTPSDALTFARRAVMTRPGGSGTALTSTGSGAGAGATRGPATAGA